MSKRLMITGGTGYLGQALIRLAHQQQWKVVASYLRQPPPDDTYTTWINLDVRDTKGIDQACLIFQPESIIHTAFQQDGPDMWDVNAMGAFQVARAARDSGARLIHMSTDVLFNGEREAPYTEDDPPDPITAYGSSKAEAEQLVSQVYPEAVLVRTSLIYGFQPIDRHTRFVLDIADGKQAARLFRDEYRCPIFVDDLARALLELATVPYQGVLHIAGAETLSRYAFGVRLATHHGRDATHLASGLSSESKQRRPRNCVLSIDRARHLLTTPLRGVEDVLTAQAQS